jgi:hypothetical protein
MSVSFLGIKNTAQRIWTSDATTEQGRVGVNRERAAGVPTSPGNHWHRDQSLSRASGRASEAIVCQRS